jgi:hypothetical protein
VAVVEEIPPEANVPYQFRIPPIAGVAVRAMAVVFWQYTISAMEGAKGFTVTFVAKRGELEQKLLAASYCST